MKHLILVLVLLFGFSSCNDTQVPRPGEPVTPTTKPSDAVTSSTTDKIEELKKKQAEALKEGNKIAALEAERDLYKALEQQHRMEANQFRDQAKEVNGALKEARIEAQQTRFYIIAITSLTLAILAFALGIWLPLVRKYAWTFAAAMIGLAALAYGIAWLIPYLLWVSLGLGLVGVGTIILWWKKDFKGLTQVVAAVDPLKAKLSDYKSHFRQFIDSDSDTQIDKIRDLEERKARKLELKQRLAEAKRAA